MACRIVHKDPSSCQNAARLQGLDLSGRGLCRKHQPCNKKHYTAKQEDEIGQHVHFRQRLGWHEGEAVGCNHTDADGRVHVKLLKELGDIHRRADHRAQQVAPELNNEEGFHCILGSLSKCRICQRTPINSHFAQSPASTGEALTRSFSFHSPNHEVGRIRGAANKKNRHWDGRHARQREGVGHRQKASPDDRREESDCSIPHAKLLL
mmetsp:Transcript_63113/g.102244  ORF Transcript_63113/g.102244 Transcript_63113/m.102244 type:complete len:208 (+) Transcript_63113:516-1139(+)